MTARTTVKLSVLSVAVIAAAASVFLIHFVRQEPAPQVPRAAPSAGSGDTQALPLAAGPDATTSTQASGTQKAGSGVLPLTADRASELRPSFEEVLVSPVAGAASSSQSVGVTLTIPQSMDTGVSWQPPIGIPVPPFGIKESHTMYRGQTFDYGSGPAPYKDAGNGPYTHYVDSTSPAATDTGNAFGSADKPRKTIPTKPPAGSVVEVHGGPYGPAEIIVVAQGTVDKPIFFRGINKPRIAGKLTVYSSTGVESRYVVVDGFDVYKFWVLAPTSYLSYRNNNIQGDATNGGIGIDSYNSAYSNHHLVFYKNVIHDNGDWQADYDQDCHGIALARYTNNVWIVDNEMYHNSGDGVQINANSLALQPFTHHIYLGRNLSYENKQSGMWTKQAVDVIFSQNTIYGLRPIGVKPSAFGAGTGFQYGPERVWFLFNHIYNCCFGISTGSTSSLGSGQDVYCIGNLIHDIHHDPNYAFTPTSSWSNAGITLVGTVNKYIINNTIVNCDGGINSPSNGKMVMINNIVSNITEPQGNHIFVEVGATASASTLAYNVLYQGGGPARIRWGSGTVYGLGAFQAATGQGAGCVTTDPLFVDATHSDYHLQAGSPAIDHGTVVDVYATYQSLYGVSLNVDYTGAVRPQGAGWDMGAFECAAGR